MCKKCGVHQDEGVVALSGDSLEMMTTSGTSREQGMLMSDGHMFYILVSPHRTITEEMPEEITGKVLAARTQCECRDFLSAFSK